MWGLDMWPLALVLVLDLHRLCMMSSIDRISFADLSVQSVQCSNTSILRSLIGLL